LRSKFSSKLSPSLAEVDWAEDVAEDETTEGGGGLFVLVATCGKTKRGSERKNKVERKEEVEEG